MAGRRVVSGVVGHTNTSLGHTANGAVVTDKLNRRCIVRAVDGDVDLLGRAIRRRHRDDVVQLRVAAGAVQRLDGTVTVIQQVAPVTVSADREMTVARRHVILRRKRRIAIDVRRRKHPARRGYPDRPIIDATGLRHAARHVTHDHRSIVRAVDLDAERTAAFAAVTIGQGISDRQDRCVTN
ncbi:hypothetical protein GFPCMMHI_05003 [Ensifer adhaerens]|nr:hypothetical protein [Ensifer adhaerens]